MTLSLHVIVFRPTLGKVLYPGRGSLIPQVADTLAPQSRPAYFGVTGASSWRHSGGAPHSSVLDCSRRRDFGCWRENQHIGHSHNLTGGCSNSLNSLNTAFASESLQVPGHTPWLECICQEGAEVAKSISPGKGWDQETFLCFWLSNLEHNGLKLLLSSQIKRWV